VALGKRPADLLWCVNHAVYQANSDPSEFGGSCRPRTLASIAYDRRLEMAAITPS
jgi:hypothetical protein